MTRRNEQAIRRKLLQQPQPASTLLGGFNFIQHREQEMTEAPKGETVAIPLGHGYVAIVDAADASLVAGRKWHVQRRPNTEIRYAVCTQDKQHVLMHHLIVSPEGKLIDHRDGDGLNNRRSNLRRATHTQNMRNRRATDHSSRFKGVSYSASSRKWRACIQVDGETVHLGYFDAEAAAARQYDRAARSFHGDFAKTNEMLGLLPPRAA